MVAVPTGLVVIANVALADPAGTVTEFGTPAAAVLLLDIEIAAPPLGAGPFSVSVPVEGVPPVTVELLRVNDASAGGWTVSEAVRVMPL